jgi:hypothetical protein
VKQPKQLYNAYIASSGGIRFPKWEDLSANVKANWMAVWEKSQKPEMHLLTEFEPEIYDQTYDQTDNRKSIYDDNHVYLGCRFEYKRYIITIWWVPNNPFDDNHFCFRWLYAIEDSKDRTENFINRTYRMGNASSRAEAYTKSRLVADKIAKQSLWMKITYIACGVLAQAILMIIVLLLL